MTPAHFIRLAFAVALSALLSGCNPDTPPPSGGAPARTFAAVVDSVAPVLLAATAAPGMAVGILEGGQVAATRGYGFADRASGRPMTAQTLLNFASLSKSVTAWGVLHLVDAGSISLDAPVGPALRRWQLPLSGFDNDGVTVRGLLSHTAGISVPWTAVFPADTPLPTLEQVLRGETGWHAPVQVVIPPGTRWRYSGGGYDILQLMVEEATGRPFAEYMRSTVFEPLAMRHTTFAPAAVSGGEVATGYDKAGYPVAPFRVVGTAAAGMYSNVDDFTRFLTVYTGQTHGIVAPRTFETMLTPMAAVDWEGIVNGVDVTGAQYALGHGVHRTRLGERIVYHSGGVPGYTAYFLVMPERGIGMVVAVNGDRGRAVLQYMLWLWGEYYGVDTQPFY
jgi:CubicO group peptidase (beta-lactamase class C family)